MVIVRNLKTKHRCLYLNSPPMIPGMRSYLAAAGVDVARAVGTGALTLSSEQNHLVAGRFVPERLLATLEEAANQALSDGYNGLFATGDMAWELGAEQDFSNLIEYEWGLEELFRRCPTLSGICQYHVGTLPVPAVRDAWFAHQVVFVNQTLSFLNPSYQGHRCNARRPDWSLSELQENLLKNGEPIDL